MISTTAAYAAVIFAAIIMMIDWQCAFLLLLFSDKPPDDTVASDTTTALHYADQHRQAQFAIFIRTLSMALMESLRQPLIAKTRNFDAKHATVNHGGL